LARYEVKNPGAADSINGFLLAVEDSDSTQAVLRQMAREHRLLQSDDWSKDPGTPGRILDEAAVAELKALEAKDDEGGLSPEETARRDELRCGPAEAARTGIGEVGPWHPAFDLGAWRDQHPLSYRHPLNLPAFASAPSLASRESAARSVMESPQWKAS